MTKAPRKLSCRQGLEKTKETSREIALQVAEAEKTEATTWDAETVDGIFFGAGIAADSKSMGCPWKWKKVIKAVIEIVMNSSNET